LPVDQVDFGSAAKLGRSLKHIDLSALTNILDLHLLEFTPLFRVFYQLSTYFSCTVIARRL